MLDVIKLNEYKGFEITKQNYLNQSIFYAENTSYGIDDENTIMDYDLHSLYDQIDEIILENEDE